MSARWHYRRPRPVANAAYHPTGIQVRDLPITLGKLLRWRVTAADAPAASPDVSVTLHRAGPAAIGCGLTDLASTGVPVMWSDENALMLRPAAGTTGLKPISVLLGGDSLAFRRSGIGRVTYEIAQAIRDLTSIASLRLWVGERLHGTDLLDQIAAQAPDSEAPDFTATVRPRQLRILLGRIPGVQAIREKRRGINMRGELQRMRAGGGRLVYHEPNMIAKRFDGTTIVQVNDLSWLHHRELHPAERIAWIERHLDRTMRQASRFVALSEFTASGLAREFGIARERIDIVPCAASAVFAPRTKEQAEATLARYDLSDRGYVLSVSTLEPRKNFDRLVDAHRALPYTLRQRHKLVIAGGSGWGTTLANAAAEQARREGTLVLLGHVPDSLLVDITARASLFAYVSLYEGFGLPLLEAMATGTPVVASSTTATGETAGMAARLVDPLDVTDISAGLRELLEDERAADMLRRRGLDHASGFTWHHTANKLLASWAAALG